MIVIRSILVPQNQRKKLEIDQSYGYGAISDNVRKCMHACAFLCSQLWSPSDQASITKLESVAKNFTSQIAELRDVDYWDRLEALKLYSQERRRERYQIIFIWKALQGHVQGYSIQSWQSPRRGRLVQVSPYHQQSPAAVRRAREASLSVRGARLFNLIPRELRDTFTVSVEQFKAGLDPWLENIPDQPTIPGRVRAAASNSLIDQTALKR